MMLVPCDISVLSVIESLQDDGLMLSVRHLKLGIGLRNMSLFVLKAKTKKAQIVDILNTISLVLKYSIKTLKQGKSKQMFLLSGKQAFSFLKCSNLFYVNILKQGRPLHSHRGFN